MLSTRLVVGAVTLVTAFLVGCPTTVPPPAAAVLEGEWDGETANGEFDVFFNSSGVVTSIVGERQDCEQATLNISNATTTLEGSAVTITIPTATGDVIYEATLSDDGNTLTGTVNRSIEIGADLELVLEQGELTLVRDTDDDDDDDDDCLRDFTATLTGASEVPPVETTATGEAHFTVTADGVDFVVTVNGGVGVTEAHIHIGGPDVNGPIVVFLFGPVEAGMDVDGTLAEGTLTADDLVNDLEGMNLSDLLDELEDGNAYVNVHTLANPAGEIRGQIETGTGGGDGGGTGDAENGATLYAANCMVCHGVDATGGIGPNIQGATADEITERVINAQGGHITFPLTEQEILDIEAYLGSFGGGPG